MHEAVHVSSGLSCPSLLAGLGGRSPFSSEGRAFKDLLQCLWIVQAPPTLGISNQGGSQAQVHYTPVQLAPVVPVMVPYGIPYMHYAYNPQAVPQGLQAQASNFEGKCSVVVPCLLAFIDNTTFLLLRLPSFVLGVTSLAIVP